MSTERTSVLKHRPKEVAAMSKQKRRVVLYVLCILALAQLACGSTTLPAAMRGGGWFPEGDKKVTFGFQMTCDKETGKVGGQFEYNDHAAKVAFHGVIDDTVSDCELDAVNPAWEGTYTPQPKKLGPGGTFKVTKVGEDDELCFRVQIFSGVFYPYQRQDCLEGGNVKFWEQED
jgi:hypothetical protein